MATSNLRLGRKSVAPEKRYMKLILDLFLLITSETLFPKQNFLCSFHSFDFSSDSSNFFFKLKATVIFCSPKPIHLQCGCEGEMLFIVQTHIYRVLLL